MSSSSTMLEGLHGGKLYIHNGYLYQLKAKRKHGSYWVCKKEDCKITLHLKNDSSIKVSQNIHEHAPEDAEIKAIVCTSRMKERVLEEPNIPILEIYR